MDIFASSDRTRRWTCQVQVCASTGKSRMAPPTTTGSTRHDQFEHVCVERCPLTTRRTAIRSRNSCGNECRAHSQTELRRDCSPEAEAETRRSRADECTITGSRAEQSLTRGAERRLRYRFLRQRLQRRGVPSDAQKWTTRGTAESTTMPTTRWPTELWDHLSPRTVPGRERVFLRVGLGSPRPRVARERACGGSARSLWLGVWCAASLGKFWRST